MDKGSAQRVVALVDMDCFYCQVETRLNPSLQGKPVAVVQYYTWKGGGIIAVNYEARNKGVTRGIRGSEAKTICPDINLISVPVLRGKADLSKYREAGDEVAEIFSVFSDNIQRASIDEAYIDLTHAVDEKIKNEVYTIHESQLKSTYVVGFSQLKTNDEENRSSGLKEWIKIVNEGTNDSPEFRLAVGALIVEEMREQIFQKTGFHSSAGIAHNKMLAKIIAGLHKPKHQTILPQDFVPELYHSLPIYKIKNLGGKFGRLITEKLSVTLMSDLYKYSLSELQQIFDEKSGLWLYNAARGIDLEPVNTRLIPDSIGCSKNFPGQNMLTNKRDVEHWVREFADEISERLRKDLEKNKRRAKLLTVSLYHTASVSRSDCLTSYDTERIVACALRILNKFNNAPESSDDWNPSIKHLGLSASKFVKELNSLDGFLTSRKDVDGNLIPHTSDNNSSKMYPDNVSNDSKTTETISKANAYESDEAEELEKMKKKSFFLRFLKKHGIHPVVQNSSEQEKPAEEVCSESSSIETEFEDSSNKCSDEVNSLAELSEDRQCTSGDIGGHGSVICSSEADHFSDKTKFCEECNKNINIIDFFEHLDYHVAVKLQTEINEEIQQNMVVNCKSSKTDIKSKRKNIETGKSYPKKFRDIKSFFHAVSK